MTNRRSLTALVGLLAAVLAVLALAPAATAGGKPCHERLIDDWYDGRIDGTYPVRCYREAQRNLPEDAEVYSDLPGDLERALQSVVGGAGGPPSSDTLIVAVPGTGRDAASEGGGDGEQAGPVIDGEDDKDSPILGKIAPSNADSIPIPLLILAALAMLLLAAAAASYIARRLQARRAPVTPASRVRGERP